MKNTKSKHSTSALDDYLKRSKASIIALREKNKLINKSTKDRLNKFDKAEKRLRQALKGWSVQEAQIFWNERIIRKTLSESKVA
jgi:hypothetical protein